MAINLNFDSVRKVCGDGQQIMVYGFQHCRYTQVTEALKQPDSPMKKVLDCSIGNPHVPRPILTTLEGRRIQQIPIPDLDQENVVRELKQYCKAGLTNIIIENIKRAKSGLPLIPVLFVVDIDGNRHPLHPKQVTSKDHTFVTFGELRRAYKLCNDPGLHPAVRAIAQDTFKFVKTCPQERLDGSIEYSVEQIAPFWTHDEWDSEWQKRKELSDKHPPEKRLLWRECLNQTLLREDSQVKRKSPSVAETASTESDVKADTKKKSSESGGFSCDRYKVAALVTLVVLGITMALTIQNPTKP